MEQKIKKIKKKKTEEKKEEKMRGDGRKEERKIH